MTLIFFKVLTPTRTPPNKPEFRKDILTAQLNNQTEKYIEKIQSILGDPRILEEFKHKVEEANRPMFTKVWASVEARGWRELARSIISILIVVAIVLSATLQFYWDGIKWLFHNINYDSVMVTAQIALAVALVGALFALRRK